jgi:Fibronectin type III domain
MRVQKSLHNLIGGTGVKLAICSSILCLFCSRTPALADPCPASDTCPTGLTATPEGPNEVMLQWTQPVSPDVSGFKVSESPQAAGQVFDLSTGPADDPRSQPIANLQAGTSYTFSVCSMPQNSCVAKQATTLPASTGAPLPVPVPVLSTSSTVNSIMVQWSSTASYSFYQVGWSFGGGGRQQSGQLQGNSFATAPLTPSTTVSVQVQGCYYGGLLGRSTCSGWKNGTGTTLAAPPCPAGTRWYYVSAQCLPAGTYQEICFNMTYNESNQSLTASCYYEPDDKGSSKFKQTTLIVSGCAPGTDIEGIRGRLQCRANLTTYGYGAAVPNGSYQQSCMWWNVQQTILSSMCWDFRGRINYGNDPQNPPDGWRIATIDLSGCDMTRDVENIKGKLTCTPRPSGQALLMIGGGGSGSPAPENMRATGPGASPSLCKAGFVWRTANAEDHVCVTPAVRQETANDNALGPERQVGPSQNGKPADCKTGYVWRQASASDYVCVTPQTRAEAQADNQAAMSRTN